MLPAGDMMITEDEVKRLGLSSNSIKVTSPFTGVEGIRAGIEVFHQLHCLNLLRMATYQDYYKTQKGGDIDTDAMDLRGHIGMS